MFRSLLTAISVAAVTAVTLMSPSAALARRCDDKPPETLLSLYRKSSEIHIGRYDRTEDFAVVEQGEDYTLVDIRKHFSISTTLKGEPRKFFVAEEQEYRYPQAEGESEDLEMEEYGMMPLKAGDTVMIFLKMDAETGSIVFSDYRDAIKKLDKDEMASYERRVGELNSIFASGPADDAALLRFIIDMTEDPVTRWEGAYELVSGFEKLEYKKQREEYLAEKAAKGEKIEDWEYEVGIYGEDPDAFDNTVFAKMLTDADKQRLTDIMIDGTSNAKEGKDESGMIAQGNYMMTELVGRWADMRLASHLLTGLRDESNEQYMNAKFMEIISNVLDNDMITGLSQKYGNLYHSDDEIVPAEEAPAGNAGEVPRQITYGELKAHVLEDFVSKSEQLLATGAIYEPSK
jgi:hypothetical protein